VAHDTLLGKQNVKPDECRDDVTDEGKIKGGIVTDDEGHDEVERKGKGRKERGRHANIETSVHNVHPFAVASPSPGLRDAECVVWQSSEMLDRMGKIYRPRALVGSRRK